MVVLGAGGALGRQLVPLLVARGDDVRPVVRTRDAAARWGAQGLRAETADILEPAALEVALRGAAVVINAATSIAKPGEPARWEQNDRIRREGTANLIAACHRTGVERLVQQSIAFLVCGTGADFVDEATPTRVLARTASAADMEAQVARSELDWVVLRGGAFYGPGTGRDEDWRTLVRSGRLRVPGDGSDYVSLIHVTDMAAAVAAAAAATLSQSVVNVVDDEPVTYGDLFDHIAEIEGAPPPERGGPPHLPSFRVRNRRARESLGWRPRVATYRSGFARARTGSQA